MIQRARNSSAKKNELKHLITMGSEDSFEPTHFELLPEPQSKPSRTNPNASQNEYDLVETEK